jgi:CIC family chloride channel protein
VACSDEPLRKVVERTADSGFARFPVLDAAGNGHIVGMISLNDLLRARTKNLEEERARERVLRIRTPFGRASSEQKVPLTNQMDLPNGHNPVTTTNSVTADKPDKTTRK